MPLNRPARRTRRISDLTPENKAWSVSEFVGLVNETFSRYLFPEGAAVEGEVAEYRVSQGKWIWFRLKDGDSAVECFATVWQLRSPLEDGMQVRVHAKPRIHPKSGKFSLNVERAEPVGEGALRRAFELLRARLEMEGAFASERKRAIPKFPERIGLIASRESAAYSDFLRILSGRWGGVTVNSLHVQVQGKDAVRDIVGAFRHFNEHPELADVIVLTRGGGSLEDLQAFNSEDVVRAVFSSRVPVVCAVGHERDESLADFAADVRASTPTHAAEIVVPDRIELAKLIAGGRRRILFAASAMVSSRRAEVSSLIGRLDSRFGAVLGLIRGRLANFSKVGRFFGRQVRAQSQGLGEAAGRLMRLSARMPCRKLERIRQAEKLLAAHDPRRPLSLGYAIVRDTDGRVIRSVRELRVGSAAGVELRDGRIDVEVKNTTHNN